MLPAWRLDAEGQQLLDAGPNSNDGQPPGAPPPTPPLGRAAAPPESAAEFEREWRRWASPQERWQYLLLATPERLPRLFRVEIGGRLLGEVVQLLEGRWREASAAGRGEAAARASAVPASNRARPSRRPCQKHPSRHPATPLWFVRPESGDELALGEVARVALRTLQALTGG
jgi:hypothetical protein